MRAHLRAFGPAPWRDIAAWAGISVEEARRGEEGLALVRYRDEAGRELVDLADAALPGPRHAGARPLPPALGRERCSSHARRTGILPEEHRPRVFTSGNPFSVGTYLVDGRVAGAWSMRDGQVVLSPLEPLSARDQRAVEREREALEAFHA